MFIIGRSFLVSILLTTFAFSPIAGAEVKRPETSNTVGPADAEAVSTPEEKSEHVWKFENGAKLIFFFSSEGPKASSEVYFQPADGARVLLRSGKVETFPGDIDARTAWGQSLGIPPTDLISFQIDHEMVFITQQGSLRRVPINHERIMRDGIAMVGATRRLVYGGKTYRLYSLPHRPGADRSNVQNPGDTFVLSPEGLFVRIDFEFHDFSKEPRIEDGILTIPGAIRQLDLDRFDIEATVKVKPLRRIERIQNNERVMVDPFEIVQAAFADLAAEARSKQLPQDDLFPEIEKEIEKALIKIERTSAVVLGDSGSGKSETLDTLIVKIVHGKTRIPRTWFIFEMSPTALGAGGEFRGATEAKVEAIKAASEAMPIIWVTDEIHSMQGQGSHSGSKMDAFEWMKSAMSKGTLRLLATSTDHDFQETIGQDPALAERFSKVAHGGPKADKLMRLLKSWLARHDRAIPEDRVLEKVIRLSNEFNAVGSQPRKSVSLLEEIYSDLLHRGYSDRAATIEDVVANAQRLYQADPAIFDSSAMRRKVTGLEAELDKRVAGQTLIKQTMVTRTRNAYAGTADPKRPQIDILMGGPKGVGKTEIAKAYAEAMGLPLVQIEMNQYAEGKVAAEFLNEIRDAMAKNAYSVLLFDEIEKAHPLIQNALLELLNSGEFTAPAWKGRRAARVSVRKATILKTANAGKAYLASLQSQHSRGGKLGFATGPAGESAGAASGMIDLGDFRKAVIAEGISELIVDRTPDVVPATFLSREQFTDVIRIHLRRAMRELGEAREIQLSLANEAEFLAAMTNQHYRPDMSNRIVHSIVDEVRAGFAQTVFGKEEGYLAAGKSFVLTFTPTGYRLEKTDFGNCQNWLQ